MKALFLFASAILCTCCITSAYAQNEWRISAGRSFVNERLGNNREYEFWLGTVGRAWQFTRPGKKLVLNNVLDAQAGIVPPQFNYPLQYDIAITSSLELAWHFSHSLGVFFSAGAGPAIQSTDTKVQARGFIFSNNITLGMRFDMLRGNLSLNPQVRFRHMSNAALNSPNMGIDSFITLMTIAVPIQTRLPSDRHHLN